MYKLVIPEIQRRIKESERETEVEETLSNEVSSEENRQSNAGEQNWDRDDDFCINFLTIMV